ncbi:MAG: galactokinase family protein, partial [Pseudomonadota bacterium]
MSAKLFKQTFGSAPAATIFTPGRVNILGEHTDYNGGLVLPAALDIGVTISILPRKDKQVRVISDAFEEMAERALSERATGHWSDYALGAVREARQLGFADGADIAMTTTLPFGAGISSSAAVCVGILRALATVNGHTLSPEETAMAARRVETDFIGVPCGIMDQMAVAVAEPGQAMALDARSLAYELIALPQTHTLVVVHSGVQRKLNEGRYAKRKAECDAAKKALGTDDLCLITEGELATLRDGPASIYRRARHCLREHAGQFAVERDRIEREQRDGEQAEDRAG